MRGSGEFSGNTTKARMTRAVALEALPPGDFRPGGGIVHTVMLLNPKGGSGKTTIATNLAAFYARQGHQTALFDHDAQGSSTQWLRVRSDDAPPIHGVAAYRNPIGMTRTWQLRVPHSAERLVVDTPAGLKQPHLASLVRTADTIIIPVLPSPIDMDAVAAFTSDLHRVRPGCKHAVRIGVVINRVPAKGTGVERMERVLVDLGLDVVARLRDSRLYPRASALGESIFDLVGRRVYSGVGDWEPLLDWLEPGRHRARSQGPESLPTQAAASA